MMQPIEIIGGGLAGLSLALGLRRAGVEVAVFEAGEYPRHRVCGEFITGLDDATIDDLQLAPHLADARRHTTTAWFVNETPVLERTLPSAALGITRHTLDARLARAFVAAGGELHTRTRVASLIPRPGRVLAMGRRRSASRWIGLKLHARGLALRRDLELHLGSEAYVGLAMTEHDAVNVCGLFRQRTLLAAECAPGGRSHEFTAGHLLARYLHACGLSALAQRLLDATVDPSSFCAVAALDYAPRTRADGEVAIGDACAMTPPFTGNGMSMAFQSAATVLPHLARYGHGDCSWSDVCRETNRALRSRFRLRLATSRLLHGFLLRPGEQRWLAALGRMRLLPFRPLYAMLH